MTESKVRRALIKRELIIGSWIQIGHPDIAQIFAEADLDWIAVDCEHTDIDVKGAASMARGIYGRGPEYLVRVKEIDTLTIRQFLDIGSQGIIVPFLNSPEEAANAVAAAKYPPEGIRGFSFTRANNWGADFNEYVRRSNAETVVIGMIETKEAVERIEDILDVNGLDGVFIGPYDLSGSYGLVGQLSHPRILNAYKKVAAACEKKGKSAGLHIVYPSKETLVRAIGDGFTFIALGMDTVYLRQGLAHTIQIARNMDKKTIE